MSMTTLEVLEGARDRIRNKDDWFGKGSIYREDRLCAMTACGEVCGLYGRHHTQASPSWAVLSETLIGMGETGSIAYYNDTHTHAEVLELFNIAIANELAKQKQPEQPKVRMATYNGHLPEPVAA